MLLHQQFPVTCHTRHVGPGSTFVAISGFKENGIHYIKQAIDLGATKIVIDKKIFNNFQKSFLDQLSQTVNIVTVDNTRKALARLSAEALDHPAKKLKIIGITGTKGKSSTTYLIEHILRASGHKTALIGGIKNKILGKEETSSLTTPESDYLHMFFAECIKKNIKYIVMEVSSHAASLYRVYGIEFYTLGFTNLNSEHMDFYQTLDKYFHAKTELFGQVPSHGHIVTNIDNQWGNKAQAIALTKPCQTISFAQQPTTTDVTFTIQHNSLKGLKLNIYSNNQKYNIAAPSLIGEFNAYNIAMATIICQKLGINKQNIEQSLKNFPGIRGRLQLHTLKNGSKAFVDFAHNESSMKAVLKTLRSLSKHLIIVFGCGGDKDKTKRPVMGSIAAHYGDIVIITDDNPRTEDRLHIIQDIIRNIPKSKCSKIIIKPDRKKAIATAAELSNKNSTLAILGKGHETHYLINGHKHYFSDLEEIQQF